MKKLTCLRKVSQLFLCRQYCLSVGNIRSTRRLGTFSEWAKLSTILNGWINLCNRKNLGLNVIARFKKNLIYQKTSDLIRRNAYIIDVFAAINARVNAKGESLNKRRKMLLSAYNLIIASVTYWRGLFLNLKCLFLNRTLHYHGW